MDRAAWDATSKLVMPKNITPIWLPSRAPEFNAVENIWQYMRANWLSNRAFDNYDAIIEAIREAWNNLMELPDTIISIGMREWAHVDGHRYNITPGKPVQDGFLKSFNGRLHDEPLNERSFTILGQACRALAIWASPTGRTSFGVD